MATDAGASGESGARCRNSRLQKASNRGTNRSIGDHLRTQFQLCTIEPSVQWSGHFGHVCGQLATCQWHDWFLTKLSISTERLSRTNSYPIGGGLYLSQQVKIVDHSDVYIVNQTNPIEDWTANYGLASFPQNPSPTGSPYHIDLVTFPILSQQDRERHV